MMEALSKYIPEAAVLPAFELIKQNDVYLKIVNERVTRHGDYRKTKDGQHQITVNASLNKYRFFVTLIHEIAHLVAFKKFGRNIKPHGTHFCPYWPYILKTLKQAVIQMLGCLWH
jgi:SprT protein